MTPAYSPLHFMEALARERRRNRAGEGATPTGTTLRRRTGHVLMWLGRKIGGEHGDVLPRVA